MRFQNLFFVPVVGFSILLGGCATQSPPKSVNENTSVNFNTANNANVLSTTKTPEAATSNNAPTVSPVVRNFYEALKKKDDAALRKVFSQAALKSLETDVKAEKKNSIAELISEVEPAPETPFEVRNERIEGETAIAEIKGGSYVNWTKVKFVRENGEWKMTNESPEFESLTKSAGNSNAAR